MSPEDVEDGSVSLNTYVSESDVASMLAADTQSLSSTGTSRKAKMPLLKVCGVVFTSVVIA